MITHIWGSDVLSRSPDPSSLNAARLVDSQIPSILDVVLDLENGRNISFEVLMTLRVYLNDIGAQRLEIPITAEAASSES